MTVEELVVSEDFLKWYWQTDEKEVKAWDKWIAQDPEHRRLANEAIKVLAAVRKTQENSIPSSEIEGAIIRLTETIRNMGGDNQSGKKTETRINLLP